MRKIKVMSVIFAIVVVLLAGFIGISLLMNTVNPPKPKTAAEHVQELALEKDHSVTPHIPQLFDSSANVVTRWSNGDVQYTFKLLEVKPELVDWIHKQPSYSFILTWYEDDKPSAQILVPFSSLERADDNIKERALKAMGTQSMRQETYEKIDSSRSWGLNWGPAKQ